MLEIFPLQGESQASQGEEKAEGTSCKERRCGQGNGGDCGPGGVVSTEGHSEQVPVGRGGEGEGGGRCARRRGRGE